MKKLALLVVVLALAVGGGAFAYTTLAPSNGGQRECSTTIICPITGEEICECCCPLGQ